MEQKSRRSVGLSFIIALILHILLLFLLFRGWIRVYYGHPEDHEREFAEYISAAGSPGTQVLLFQPPTPMVMLDVPGSSATTPVSSFADSQSAQTSPVLEEAPAAGPELETSLGVESASDAATTVFEMGIEKEPIAACPLPTQALQPPLKSRKNRRKAAAEALQKLSFDGVYSGKQQHFVTSAGCGSAREKDRALMHRVYTHKVLSVAARAINTDGIPCHLSHNFRCATTLILKIKRDGTLLDVYFDPCPLELVVFAQEVYACMRSTGLYPRIPKGITADPALVSLPLVVEGRAGSGTYHLTYEYW